MSELTDDEYERLLDLFNYGLNNAVTSNERIKLRELREKVIEAVIDDE